MLGAVFEGSGRVAVKQFPDPVPKPGEALVKVAVSGLCGSELPPYQGKGTGGTIPGHEITGQVLEVNQTRHVRMGDRVALQIMVGCGSCYYCDQGDPKHCFNMSYLLGGHAQLIAAPEMCCLRLPDDVDYELGVLLGGDTIGTTYRTLKRLGVAAFDTVAVLGCGPIGLGMLALLQFIGARAIAADPSPYRREMAKHLGAFRVVDPRAEAFCDVVREVTSGLGADVALDCSGVSETLTAALDCVRFFGKVAFVGEKGDTVIHPSSQVIHKELEIIGSWYYTAEDFQEILGLYRRGLSVSGLVTHRFQLQEADRAFATFASAESGKVLIVHPAQT